MQVHDGNLKRIRYLDLFDYRCYLNIKVPRIRCNKDCVEVVNSTPWDCKGNHYSLKFEALIMRLYREMSASALDTGKVIFVTEGRKKEVFEFFYGWLWDNGGYPGNIKLFSMGMSVSYQAGQKEYFARTEVVFDRFHIKKGMNKALNLVRIEEVKRVESLKI